MKNYVVDLIICVVSLAITFLLFEILGWYHIGDMPTTMVISRLIIFFIIINVVLTGIVVLVRKIKK